MFTRPFFPSPVAAGWNGSPLAFPRAPHPALTGDARRGGDRSSSTDLNQRSLRHRPSLQSSVDLSMRATSRRTRPSGSLPSAALSAHRREGGAALGMLLPVAGQGSRDGTRASQRAAGLRPVGVRQEPVAADGRFGRGSQLMTWRNPWVDGVDGGLPNPGVVASAAVKSDC